MLLSGSKPERVKRDWVENYSKISHFLTPVRFRGGMGRWRKRMSEFYEFSLGRNVGYTFAGSPLRGLGPGCSVYMLKIKDSSKT